MVAHPLLSFHLSACPLFPVHLSLVVSRLFDALPGPSLHESQMPTGLSALQGPYRLLSKAILLFQVFQHFISYVSSCVQDIDFPVAISSHKAKSLGNSVLQLCPQVKVMWLHGQGK
jgi:hypothetical protein